MLVLFRQSGRDLRGEEPARLFGQTQTGQKTDEQVQDQQQQVAQPPPEKTHTLELNQDDLCH